MPINQESLLPISMPIFVITVKYTYPQKTHFQKTVGGGNEIILWQFKYNESGIKLNFVLIGSAWMLKISSKSCIILWSKHFHIWQWSFVIALFSENNVCTLQSRIRFSIIILCLFIIIIICLLERCPDKLYKYCHRQTLIPVVWTDCLVIRLRHSQNGQASLAKRGGWYRRD